MLNTLCFFRSSRLDLAKIEQPQHIFQKLHLGLNPAFAIVFGGLGGLLVASEPLKSRWECLEAQNKWSWMVIEGVTTQETTHSTLWLGHSVDTHYRCDGTLKGTAIEEWKATYHGSCVSLDSSSVVPSTWQIQSLPGSDQGSVILRSNTADSYKSRSFDCYRQEGFHDDSHFKTTLQGRFDI